MLRKQQARDEIILIVTWNAAGRWGERAILQPEEVSSINSN